MANCEKTNESKSKIVVKTTQFTPAKKLQSKIQPTPPNFAWHPVFEDRACYRCGKIGHLIRDCTWTKLCFRCGGPGHIAKECRIARESRKLKYMECYECGSTGHVRRNCPEFY